MKEDDNSNYTEEVAICPLINADSVGCMGSKETWRYFLSKRTVACVIDLFENLDLNFTNDKGYKDLLSF